MISTQRIWFSTVLISPIIFWTSMFILENQKLSAVFFILPALLPSVIIGFVLSIPTMSLFYLANKKLEVKNFADWKLKVFLSLILLFGILITFFLIDFSFFSSAKGLRFPSPYILCSLSTLWFFSRKKNITKL